MIDAQVPYARAALDNYVGFEAEQHVSRDEALIMANRAWKRAAALSEMSDFDVPLVGLSCTAAIATDRLRRGENRAHIAWDDGTRVIAYSIVLKKGCRERAGEEKLCSAIILNALAEACSVNDRLDLDLLEGEIVERFSD